MIHSTMKSANSESKTRAIEELCKIFESAATHAKRAKGQAKPTTPSDFTNKEIEWFCRNSYNVALEACADVNPLYLARLTATCCHFIKLLLADGMTDEADSLRLRRVLCEFMNVCSFTVLGRHEDQLDLSVGP
jgi:hypothetical protein